MRAVTAPPTGDPRDFDLFSQSADATVLILPSREELLLGRGSRALRISIDQGSLLEGPVTLEFRITASEALLTRLRTIRRFAVFSRGKDARIQPQPVRAVARRVLQLRAIDALAVDPRQRQVARTLFGEAVVDAEWNGPSDFLRSRVRRLIAQARQLSRGDVTRLLAE